MNHGRWIQWTPNQVLHRNENLPPLQFGFSRRALRSSKKMMAPEKILKASLRVLFVAAYTTRNWTLSEDVSRKQINDLWEAIHEIPDLLKRWRADAETELLMYLKEYNEKWDAPNLLEVYQEGLKE
jgi:hypothetical protein